MENKNKAEQKRNVGQMKNKRNDDKIPWTANLSELCFCFSLVYLPHNFTHVWLVLSSSLSLSLSLLLLLTLLKCV